LTPAHGRNIGINDRNDHALPWAARVLAVAATVEAIADHYADRI
jgi:hypothetical protein